VNGAVLENGMVLRMPPPEAERVQVLLQSGQPVTVRGTTLKTTLGTVIDASAIGASPDQITELGAGPGPVVRGATRCADRVASPISGLRRRARRGDERRIETRVEALRS
jgi:hypothetical protein